MAKKQSLMSQFKRENNSQYKSSYKIKNPTHLVQVVTALSKFPTALSKISELGKLDTSHLQTEASRLDKFLNTKQKQVLLKLMYLEQNDKQRLKRILDIGIINNNNIEKEMISLVKYREQALDYAVALGVIDDYYEYLETGTYNGPTTKLAEDN